MSYTKKTAAEIAAAEERNRLAPVPPGFGAGKCWRLRIVEWEIADGKEVSVMIPNGMAVNKTLHSHYWGRT
jgi:hypothetical protein